MVLNRVDYLLGWGIRIFFVWYLLALVAAHPASAKTAAFPVITDSSVDKQLITQQLEIYEDVGGSFSFDDILNREKNLEFIPHEVEGVPSFGYQTTAIWLRFRLLNSGNDTFHSVLEIPYSPLDYLDVYVQSAQDSAEFQHKIAGDSRPFSVREIDVTNAAFFIETPPAQYQWIYIRVQSSSSLQIPIVLWTHKAFVAASASDLLFWGLYFGALFVAAGYNLFLFLSLKDRVYVLYVLFVLSVALFQLCMHGFASEYLWPEAPAITNYALLFALNSMGVAAVPFSVVFLKMDHYVPKVSLALKVIAVIMVLNILSMWLIPYLIIIQLAIFLFAIGAILLIYSGGYCWYRGFTPARIYFLAWLVMLAGAFIFSLKTLGLIPATPFSNYAVTIGSALEVILLSLAIADRVNVERMLKKQAQNKILDMQKALLEANKKALANAEQSDQIKQRFLATMSHELRTPLNGILGCTQLLQDAQLDRENANTVSYLATSAKQMHSHVNRLLNFSQLHEGKLAVEQTDFNLASLIKHVRENYEDQCTIKGLSFSLQVADNLGGNYYGDENKIRLILGDLLDNAIKFTDQGGITVTIAPDHERPSDESNHWLRFSVTDTGRGISPSYKTMLFEMFSQQDGTFKRSHEGMGLGLAICHKYVELLNGELRFETEPNKGSYFTFVVPLRVSAQATRESSPIEARLPTQSGREEIRVLVVEDNLINQMIIVKMLGKLGYQSELAENGVEAMQRLETNHFDLILMDCHMPVMDGFEATQRIRSSAASYSQLPIIAVTANAAAGDRDRCLAAGMDDYIAKPVSRKLLEEKLAAWSGTKSQYRQVAPDK